MGVFVARSLLIFWFFGMFASWLWGTANRLPNMAVESWQVHLSFVIAIVVLTNLIFLIKSLYLVSSLPIIYFAFIYFKSRHHGFSSSPTTATDMLLYLMEIGFFTIIVFMNYTVTDGRAVRLAPKYKPILRPPQIRPQARR